MLPNHPDQMSNQEIDDWIRRLVDTGEPEGIHLDYKQELKLTTTQDRRELVKDISSFANEVGGTLIYGVPEKRDSPQTAPRPMRPYGIDAIPGVVESIENICVSTAVPTIPEYRILPVGLSEYPGKLCYVVWTPESWASPHMVSGYDDARYYRRGQYRSVQMTERDVEERYRRRLFLQSAAQDFLETIEANNLLRGYNRIQATTTLMVVPLLLTHNRVNFSLPSIRDWLSNNTLWRNWVPSMQGVRTFVTHGPGEKADVEIHRNGAYVACHYTQIDESSGPGYIASGAELQELKERLDNAANFYQAISYNGPLLISLRIWCPTGYALFLIRRTGGPVALEPSGTDIDVRFDSAASGLNSGSGEVHKALADRLFQTFGFWQSD